MIIDATHLGRIVSRTINSVALATRTKLALTRLTPVLTDTGRFLTLSPTCSRQTALNNIITANSTKSLQRHCNNIHSVLLNLALIHCSNRITGTKKQIIGGITNCSLVGLLANSCNALNVVSRLAFQLFPQRSTSGAIIVPNLTSALRGLLTEIQQSSLAPITLSLLSPTLARHLNCNTRLTLMTQFRSVTPNMIRRIRALLHVIPRTLATRILKKRTRSSL